ncbi:MAG: primosomal protein N' [bacterium]
MKARYVEIAFPLPVNHTFTYQIPSELVGTVRVGCRVIAPLGPRRLTGFIVKLKDSTEFKELKAIIDVLDLEPLFSPDILRLSEWIAEYYLCSRGEALKATLPSFFLRASRKVVYARHPDVEEAASKLETTSPRQAQILRYLAKGGKISVQHLKRKIGAQNLYSSLNQLIKRKLIGTEQSFANSQAKPKTRNFVRLQAEVSSLIEALNKTAPVRARCLSYLQAADRAISQAELVKETGITSQALKSMAKSKLVGIFKADVLRDFYSHIQIEAPQAVRLNPEQSQALAEIDQAIAGQQFKTFLLFGITGSGKTQVYIEAIKKALEQGRDAIVLVPEIALTPQTVQRFRSYFREQVAVLHSVMSAGERYDGWRRLRKGQARVAIGPRSAIFAPLRRVGLIVVDEEHETSYKQSDSPPRYHARDVAIMRAKFTNAVVILGSATPSAESYFNAQVGKYRLLELTHRIDHVPLPEVKILDLIKEKRLSGKKEEPIFSRLLLQKIDEKLSKQEQIILLLNRRGFSSFIKCKDCGYIENCENCNITLTYHLPGHLLRCHYCSFTKRAPTLCPACQGPDIIFRGVGTQKVEKALKQVMPQARVVRMDLDTTSKKHAHDRILHDFGLGKYDILLGTQMIAKGLDFHKVTLVGVINADVGLLIPDFRATERTFHLLTQVAGRAGRKHLPGEVIIQTYSPKNESLICAQQHDFRQFFYGEISERKELHYPPYGKLVSILFRGEDEKQVVVASKKFASVIKTCQGPFKILGPTPSPILKIQNKFRYHLILKGDRHQDPAGKIMRQSVRTAQSNFANLHKSRGVQIVVDVDPQALI